MSVDTPMVALASGLVLACVAVVLVRTMRGTSTIRERLASFLNPSIGALSVGSIWMLRGADPAIALLQAAVGAICVTSIGIVTAGVLAGAARIFFTISWSAGVLAPVGLALFDLREGVLVVTFGTLDFAGAATLGVCTGLVAPILVLLARREEQPARDKATVPHHPWLLYSVAVVVGCAALGVASELVLDSATGTILTAVFLAAAAGAIGWMAAQGLISRLVTQAGLFRGIVSGLVASLPALPWLHPIAVVVLATIAGLLGAVTAGSCHTRGAGYVTFLTGSLLIPGVLGLLATGLVAQRIGLLYSGHPDQLIAQGAGLVAVLGYASVATTVLAFAALRVNTLSTARATVASG